MVVFSRLSSLIYGKGRSLLPTEEMFQNSEFRQECLLSDFCGGQAVAGHRGMNESYLQLLPAVCMVENRGIHHINGCLPLKTCPVIGTSITCCNFLTVFFSGET